MNNVWQTRCRMLSEQLEALAHRLGNKQPISPTVLDEHTVRLLIGVIMEAYSRAAPEVKCYNG